MRDWSLRGDSRLVVQDRSLGGEFRLEGDELSVRRGWESPLGDRVCVCGGLRGTLESDSSTILGRGVNHTLDSRSHGLLRAGLLLLLGSSSVGVSVEEEALLVTL